MALVGREGSAYRLKASWVVLRQCSWCGAVRIAGQFRFRNRLSEHSLNSKIRCLRAFGRWLVRKRWLAESPFEGLELAGAPKLRKKVLSEDEINRLFP